MLRDLINREKFLRALLYFIYILVVEFFQDTLFARLSLFGVNMMFVPAAVVAIGAFEGGVWGAAFGLIAGFFADISFGNVALFTVVFPVIGFFAGVAARWLVNASLFAYLVMCLAAFAVTAAAQSFELILRGQELGALLRTGIIQTLWSLPMAAALYFPCRAIGKRKV